ncbi:hypothetical protein ACLB2K_026953 [Fragaria x ananassa]
MPCGNPNCSCGSSCSCGDDCKCGRTGLGFSENTIVGIAPLKMYYGDSEMNFGELVCCGSLLAELWFSLLLWIDVRPEADVRTVLKLWTSLRSHPSGAGNGVSPPQNTPAASSTTFPQTWVISSEPCGRPSVQRRRRCASTPEHSSSLLDHFPSNLGDLAGKLKKNGLARDGKWSGTLLESFGVEARCRRGRSVENEWTCASRVRMSTFDPASTHTRRDVRKPSTDVHL